MRPVFNAGGASPSGTWALAGAIGGGGEDDGDGVLEVLTPPRNLNGAGDGERVTALNSSS